MAELTIEGNLTRNAIGAVLFLSSVNMTYQAFGTLNSSPWTTENVGADDEKRSSMYEYVAHASAAAFLAAVVSAHLARSWWPIVGVLLADVYLVWVYHRAAKRGNAAGSDGSGWFDTWGKN